MDKKAAEYAVAAELCRRGWLAQVLPAGWAQYDLVALSQDRQQVWLQVRSTQKSKDVFAPKGPEPPDCVFVKADDDFQFFVVPGPDVASLRDKATADYLVDHPGSGIIPSIRWNQLEPWRDRWDDVGVDTSPSG